MISQFVAALIVGVTTFVPGILLSFALLHGVKLGKLEKMLFGIVIGLVAAPILSVIEFTFLRESYSAAVFVLNSLLVGAVALVILYRQNQLEHLPSISLPKPGAFEVTPKRVEEWLRNNWVLCLVVGLVLFGFYVRFATSWATNFFEFDPYYYDKVTERLVQKGFIPLFTSESYYPQQAFMRWAPITHYLAGGWYMLYQSVLGAAYSKDVLILTAQLYPPIVGALLSFLAFLIIREEYNEYIALIPAAFFAFTPQLINKLAAGVNEQQPWGIFTSVLLFAAYFLAVNRRSYRLAVLAAISAAAAMLGSQQFIWPFIIISVYVAFQTVLDFVAGETDEKLLKINAIVGVGALVANLLMYLFQEKQYTPLVHNTVLLWIAAIAFSAVLYAVNRFVSVKSFKERAAVCSVIIIVAAIAAALTPIGANAIGYVTSTTSFATAGSALEKTIQEEGITSPSLFASSFGIFDGVLQPSNVLQVAALLAVLSAALSLWLKKFKRGAIVFGVAVFLVVLLNAQLDGVLQWLASGSGNASVVAAVNFFVQNDVFLYMLIAMLATSVSYLVAEKKNRSALLFVLIFFPVAYIGLNKLKYMLHLAVALCIAVGYILGEALRSAEFAGEIVSISDRKTLFKYCLAGLFIIGLILAALQARTVSASMDGLKGTRISSDWVEAYKWMNENTPTDSRVMSWWDYGHWTTFFGNRNTVLDPNNAFSNYDQGVARSFVNGNPEDLYSRMDYHNATYLLADADLVGKWGALVFLSGSCIEAQSPVCPQTPEIDWRAGPGASKYEAEHYYEYLNVVGNCPLTASPVSLPALQSSFGSVYCAGQNELFLLTRSGTLNQNYSRSYEIMGQQSSGVLSANTSYLFPIGQGQFINVNPDLSYVGLDNRVFYSEFTRLFFFQSLPGFELVHSTPNGQVKIFRYTGKPTLASIQNSLSLPPVTPPSSTPVPSAVPSPAPTTEPNASVTAAASASPNASLEPIPSSSAIPSNSPVPSPSAPSASPAASPVASPAASASPAVSVSPAASAAPSSTPSPTV